MKLDFVGRMSDMEFMIHVLIIAFLKSVMWCIAWKPA